MQRPIFSGRVCFTFLPMKRIEQTVAIAMSFLSVGKIWIPEFYSLMDVVPLVPFIRCRIYLHGAACHVCICSNVGSIELSKGNFVGFFVFHVFSCINFRIS
jgi:hypothetical protein